jgi:hypothetical protein
LLAAIGLAELDAGDLGDGVPFVGGSQRHVQQGDPDDRLGREFRIYIEPHTPWENGYRESLDGKLQDELLNGEIFYSSKETKVLIEQWRQHYNTARP